MKNLLFLCLFCLAVASLPTPGSAEGPPPFQVIYRQENPVVGEITTTSNLLLTVINRSSVEARDVVVSAKEVNPYCLINLPLSFGNIPSGAHTEILVQAEVPNMFVADGHTADVVWQIQYLTGNGDAVTTEIVGEKGL